MNLSIIAMRNIFRKKWRSLLSLSAISAVTMFIVFMFSFLEGFKADMENTVVKFATGQARVRNAGLEQYQFTYPEEFMIDDYPRVRDALERLPGVDQVQGRLSFGGQIAVAWKTVNPGTPAEFNLFDQTASAAVIGLDETSPDGFFSIAPFVKAGGKMPGAGDILVADGFAAKFGLQPGDTVFLFAGTGSLRLKVSGIVALPIEQLRLKSVYLPLGTAQELMALEGRAQEILIRFKERGDLTAAAISLQTALAKAGFKNLEVKPWTEINSTVALIDMAGIMFNFMAFFFFLLGATVILNTIMMMIYERMREIGTLRAMGMTGSEMIRLFFLEAFFISAAAALVGVVLGTLLVLPLSVTGVDLGKLADVGKMGLDVSNVIYPQLNLISTAFVFVFSVAIASLVSFIPTRRAAKIEPVEALRSV